MCKRSFFNLYRGIFAAVALLTASTGAHAFFNNVADPFIGQTVNLQTTGGTLVALPGVGPGGTTLFANQFIISNFNFVTSNSNGMNSYTADFGVNFLDSSGNPVGAGATLTGGAFDVTFVGRTSPFQTGTFTADLTNVAFSGVTSLGTPINVSLANTTSATIDITANPAGGFDITYLTGFAINGQYAVNGGPTVQVPGLVDVNNGLPTGVPEPSLGFLVILGALAMMFGLRRRRPMVEAMAAA
ncbi:MAG: PEP-CTERM sorting domain-containing protein [Gammaproteobacteria bacterium]